ncbi:phosphatidylserine decarboxylase [Saccharospirillum sp. MSK14-1]|uniref:archaetidylserine decarboxylase n=1 Tax=Saccharospirillum sp. MSK14-1 TaxID=1897632 RepID=UPI000D471139|nr:archaetidylserine decarboxylase [Saccharospirillum sp. MSK14-1]PTY38618.1 phosphatidylserine decarboxylase [Saccharospirillum sp. MSK14-1]
MSSLTERLFVASQYLAPHHLLSRFVGRLAASEWAPIRRLFIGRFAKQFQVNMSEAERENLTDYRNFNDFFTRALKPGARPLPEDPQRLMCPVDGAVSQAGPIENGRIFQAKGRDYSLTELLGGDADQGKAFRDGRFATLYLSPRDYHRIHMPCDGKLIRTTFVPGRLFSVNGVTADNVPRLFARNERLVCEFETAHGRMILVLVGAMIVASIETVWAGIVAPDGRRIKHQHFGEDGPQFKRGDEMGRFRLGSTVIALFEADALEWDATISAGQPVRLGQPLNATK